MSNMKLVRVLPVCALLLGACQSTNSNSVSPFAGNTSSTRTTQGATNTGRGNGQVNGGEGWQLVGRQAPGFSLADANGQRVSLGDFRGKTVVLEWFNPKCEFVSSLHENGTFGNTAQGLSSQGVQFIAINSTAPGNIGFSSAYGQAMCNQWDVEYPLLADPNGTVQSQFGVTLSPTVVVIDPQGVVRYFGAPDNSPLGNQRGNTYVNHVQNAINAIQAGEEVKRPTTKEYGCEIERQNRAN